MQVIKVAFCDFWKDFDEQHNLMVEALRKSFEVDVVSPYKHPDVLFYSCFGYSNVQFLEPIRIYYTGENDHPDFNWCDWSISMRTDIGAKNIYLPLAITNRWDELDHLRMPLLPENSEKREFCSVVVSNMTLADPMRTKVWDTVASYKYVASGGAYRNNVGGPVPDKQQFISQYKFNLALENSSVPGYITEKISDAWYAGTVPIYWGAENVFEYFNSGTFIDVSSFPTLGAALSYIKKVDSDDELYLSYFCNDPFTMNGAMWRWKERLAEFLWRAVRNGKTLPEHGRVQMIHYMWKQLAK